jgi:hypothetical protein
MAFLGRPASAASWKTIITIDIIDLEQPHYLSTLLKNGPVIPQPHMPKLQAHLQI